MYICSYINTYTHYIYIQIYIYIYVCVSGMVDEILRAKAETRPR